MQASPTKTTDARAAMAQARPPVDPTDASAGKAPRFHRCFGPLVPWLTSTALHAAVLVVLTLLFVGGPWGDGRAVLTLSTSDADGQLEPEELASPVEVQPDTGVDSVPGPTVVAELQPVEVDLPRLSTPAIARTSSASVVRFAKGGLAGRRPANRRALALRNGGTEKSEAAVERGLAWLAEHQFADGGWRFDFRRAPKCIGNCADHGSLESTTGATGLSLIAFLGAGYTHRDGPYQQAVEDGLYYLTTQMVLTDEGGDLRGEGQSYGMYSHAIATLALCEAYAMTQDPHFRGPAQLAVDYIVFAQHEGGGWRYGPREPGDTTVTGWQVIALKAALLAGLEVPTPIWFGVERFLDRVQADDGAYYGYRHPGREPTNTSIGLLCRMMLGWKRDRPAIRRGVAYLSRQGPSQRDLYFNYYASQVVRHYGGKPWRRWNAKLRDFLVNSQAQLGHERGSWQFRERHSLSAGRLYNTAMAVMTLEVYYRYLPLYDSAAVDVTP